VINAVNALAELLGAPPSPAEPVDWDVVERQLGTRLPADYVEWSDRYPSMEFGGTYFKALAWSAPALIEAGPKEAAVWGQIDLGQTFHPEPGGLLPWGQDEEGGAFFWRTEGDPDDWPVVYCPRFRFFQFDYGFTGFLHGMFTGEIRHPELPPDCIGPGVQVDWF
jgi:hypothetical protein